MENRTVLSGRALIEPDRDQTQPPRPMKAGLTRGTNLQYRRGWVWLLVP